MILDHIIAQMKSDGKAAKKRQEKQWGAGDDIKEEKPRVNLAVQRRRTEVKRLMLSGMLPKDIATEIPTAYRTVWDDIKWLRDQGEIPAGKRRNSV